MLLKFISKALASFTYRNKFNYRLFSDEEILANNLLGSQTKLHRYFYASKYFPQSCLL